MYTETFKDHIMSWKGIILFVCLLVLVGAMGIKYVLDLSNYGSNPDTDAEHTPAEHSVVEVGPGRNFFLPDWRHKLIGRDEKMETVTNYLKDDTVQVVNLFSAPGYGKSEMSLHIGHNELKFGTDVYYINVKILTDIKRLQEKLISIGELKAATGEDKIVKWAEQINRTTLLILDNVDGRTWGNDIVLAKFYTDFVKVLLQYSHSNLKVLITSQQEIKMSSKFRSVPLPTPGLESCVTMFSEFANEVSNDIYTVIDGACAVESPLCIPKSKVETMCTLVGKVPKAVEVLASVLSPPFITISFVIERLEEINALKYLNKSANVGDETLLSAFEIAFKFISFKYQVCCLLLTKFPGALTVAKTELIITPDLMTPYSESFHVRECLNELYRRSFIEITSYSNLKGECYFHTLTRNFLMITDEVVIPRNVLEVFWDTFFAKAHDVKGQEWIRDDLGMEDTELIVQFLSHGHYDSYRLAQHLTYNYDIKQFLKMGTITERYQLINDAAVNALLADCKLAGLTYPAANISIILNSYYNIFAHILPYDEHYMDKLAVCVTKVEQLYSLKKSSDYLALFKGFDFYYMVNMKCRRIQNSHKLCNERWKFNLLHFIRKLILVMHTLVDHCNHKIQTPGCTSNLARYTNAGLISYIEGDETKAGQYLWLALNSSSKCVEVRNAIMYIALYSIFSKRSDQQIAKESLASIVQINFQDVDMTCHQTLYMDIVIPFLNSTNCTDLAGELWKKTNEFTALSTSSDKTGLKDSLEVPHWLMNAEVIRSMKPSDAYKAGVRVGQFAALKSTPLFGPDESSQLTPEIAEEILEGKASLFCFVSKDMVEECHSHHS